MKIIGLLVTISLLLFVPWGMALTYCEEVSGEVHSEGEIINTMCPVMGGEADSDTPYRAEYNGKMYGFCCPNCVDTFMSDPERYVEESNE